MLLSGEQNMNQESKLGTITSAEKEDYDSGIPTDSERRTPEKPPLTLKEHVSDYETGCSSSDAIDGQAEEGSPGDAQSQMVMDSEPIINQAKDSSSNKLEEEPHTVTCTVTISFAMPAQPKKDDHQPSSAHKGKKGHKLHKKVIEAPKAQNYFHFEYFLLPEDTEPTKVDVVMFGVVAKLYMEHESRLLKPWQEGDKIWLVWSHSVDLHVTKGVLMKALTHQIEVKMWDTKDKVSAKARFDRPKAFRVSHVRHGEEPEVKQLIMNQRRAFEESLPRPSFILKNSKNIEVQENLCAQVPKHVSNEKSQSVRFPFSSSIVQENLLRRSETSNAGLSAMSASEKLPARRSDKHKSAGSLEDVKAGLHKYNGTHFLRDLKMEASSSKLLKQVSAEMIEKASSVQSVHLERNCLSMNLSFMPLLAGDLMVTGRLQESSDKILDSYMSLAIDCSLLSQQQRQDLNPLVIRILSATRLPTMPTPISVLQDKCLPVYCRYRFQNQPHHQTHGQAHGTHVFFRDVNVIFAGTISSGELRESLLGPPIEIEVHDRDQKPEGSLSRPSLFGMEPEDEKLSNVGLVTSKRTVHNPFTERGKQWDPYGVAKISLSELVYGATYMNICVPIHSCEPPDPTGYQSDSNNGRILGVEGSVDGPQSFPLPTGHYLDAQSHLKVRVDLAVPLSLDDESPDCPFGRMVCIFDYKNRELFNELMLRITDINSKALGLNLNNINVNMDILSRDGLTDDQKYDTQDVITGVHIMDKSFHLFILEGLKNKAIKELWETLARSSEGSEEKLEILYNSEMAFHERLYKELGVLLCHIHLHEPLSSLVNQPLLYVRDMVPPLCFQALSRLNYICNAKKLRDVIHANLLPTSEMIHLLSREFGIPFNFGDLFVDKENSISKKLVISEGEDAWRNYGTLWHNSLDNHNEAYILWKEEMDKQENKDYIKKNIDHIYKLSKTLRRPKEEYIEIVPLERTAVHNYSSHTFNSTDVAYRLLREKMAKEPSRRFTYSLDYQSATVSPVDIQEEQKRTTAKSKEEWMTPNGFRYPGWKSSIECNNHPRKPDEARILELTKAWKENILHANILQPTLCRERWRWSKRHADFELYRKPVERCSVSAPCPLYPAGDGFLEEQKAALSPIDTRQKMRLHRCLPQTELTSQGPQSSNQLSRLEGLLKDKGAKYSLRKPGLALKPIPALSAIPNTEEPITKHGFLPGDLRDHSLKWTDNIIPRYSLERETFQQLRGNDFDLYSTNHAFSWKRRIEDLTPDEKNSFGFIKPKTANGSIPAAKMAEDSHNILRIQSHTGFLLQMQ